MAITKRGKPLTDIELQEILGAHVRQGVNYMQDNFTSTRIEAQKFYEGRKEILPFKKGRSSVVSLDVSEAIDTLMPGIMNIFGSTDEPVRFMARKPQDEPIAEQATDYASWVWYTSNSGFRIFYDWFKSAVLYRLGVVKIWWDESESVKQEEYENLDEASVNALASDPDVEFVKEKYYTDPRAIQLAENMAKHQAAQQVMMQIYAGQEPAPPAPVQIDETQLPKLCDVTVKRVTKNGRIKVQVLPPEELLFDQYKVDADDRNMIGHRRRMTASELREMGYADKLIDQISFGNLALDTVEEVSTRFRPESAWPLREPHPNDPSSEQTWVNELYLYVDADGDGVAEYRKITAAGDGDFVILDNEIVDDHPFAICTPILSPFKMVGLSLYDLTRDVQLIKTSLLRNVLDNVYQTTNQRYVINNNVNMDDVLNSAPGSPIRANNPQTDIMPLPVMDVTQNGMNMIQYFDQVRENRTGVSRHGSGLDPDILKSHQSAGAIQSVMDASGQRMELIARTFAETGVARAFRRILDLATKHEDKEVTIKLRGQWQAFRPSDWHSNFDITPQVGLGTGNRDAEIQRALQFFPIAAQIVQMPGGTDIITPKNVYASYRRLVESSGFKNPDLYCSDPSQAPPKPPQQPPVDPTQVAAQVEMAKTEIEQKEKARQFDLKHALTQQQHADDIALKAKAQDNNHEIDLKRLEIDALKIHASGVAAEQSNEVKALQMHHAQQAQAADQQHAAEQAQQAQQAAQQQQAADQAHQQQMQQQAAQQAAQQPPQGAE